jgi:hypothetical protein
MLLPVEADKGNDMILSTMNDLPGYEITEVTGERRRMTVDRKGGNRGCRIT